MSTESTLITVNDLHKSYDRTRAVRGISFHVAAGQILGLVGPNGAGKTTTLRTLSAIIPATHGQLTVDGFCVENDSIEVKRRLAYIPDDPQLFEDLTVLQHLAFTASAYGIQDADSQADRLLECFQLADKREAPVRSLSRGMRQKLAISCAYLQRPTALLFDEPLTGLDPQGIRMFKQSITERSQGGAAIIISSHLLAMVEDICTHVLILQQGSQRFFGTMQDLKAEFAETTDDQTLEDIFFQATNVGQDQPTTLEVTDELVEV